MKSQKTPEPWDYIPEMLFGFRVFWHGVILGAVITRYLCDLGRGEKSLIQLLNHAFPIEVILSVTKAE